MMSEEEKKGTEKVEEKKGTEKVEEKKGTEKVPKTTDAGTEEPGKKFCSHCGAEMSSPKEEEAKLVRGAVKVDELRLKCDPNPATVEVKVGVLVVTIPPIEVIFS